MTTVAATQSAAYRGIWPEFGRSIELAVSAAMDRLAPIEPGRLASLSIVLPTVLDATSPPRGGDSCWLARSQDLSLYGSGVAVRFDDTASERFQAACARWCLLDAQNVSPVAWFSVPSATALPGPTVWVPRVLLRMDRDRTIITLSVRRDATRPSDVGRGWLEELRQLLESGAKGRHATNPLLSKVSTPDAETWRSRVQAATAAIASGQLTKVVLARRLSIRLTNPVVPRALAERLASVQPECFVFSLPLGPGFVVAASPELLAAKRGSRLVSHAVAGTARRHDGAADNALAATALLGSPKERREHAVVVDAIAARMAEICDGVAHPLAPTVLPLRFLQHLWTPVSGRLRPGVSLLDAVTHLHPTPAVLGFPLKAARDWLGKIGECRDGLYSGVAGWIDADGNGDGVVVLRSAYVEDRSAVLWAGAGIVEESDPDAELAETELKLATMLEVLQT